MKNYKELFDDRWDEAQKLDELMAKKLNELGFDGALEYAKSIGCNWLNYVNYFVKYYINEFTLEEKNDDPVVLDEFFNKLGNDVILLSKDDRYLTMLVKDQRTGVSYKVEVENFLKRNPRAIEILPDLDSNDRRGTCYNKARTICLLFKGDTEVVTGYIYGYSDKAKFLHSWVEVNIDGKDYVIDGTYNAIFNKEAYYRLQNAEVLTRISKNELINDFIYGEILSEINLDIYYLFRDYLIRDMDRNKHILKLEK